jgi:pantoate--beta-alanine ligase
MKLLSKITEWRQIRSELTGQRIGIVPTMGYLHEGHVSLVHQAKKENDIVVLSIFVNPLQFGVNEDFSTYPRDIERDSQLAIDAGVDYIFTPEVEEMYPTPIRTNVKVNEITEMLCGASRPGHFDGVATVVMKLLQIIQPHNAYFGMKDAQQVAVIEQMVHDLNVPVYIRTCPILRESDGLAMSSRNVYLSADEREEAPILYKTLQWAVEAISQGERDVEQIVKEVAKRIELSPSSQIDYVELRQYPSLDIIQRVEGKILLALAVRMGRTRLIDNVILTV